MNVPVNICIYSEVGSCGTMVFGETLIKAWGILHAVVFLSYFYNNIKTVNEVMFKNKYITFSEEIFGSKTVV